MQFNLQKSIASSKAEVYEVVFQIQRMRFFVGYHEMYRGQERDRQWKLETNLGRAITRSSDAYRMEKKMLEDFGQRLEAAHLSIQVNPEYQTAKFHRDWHLLLQAHYYGLPTRLMDWTSKWEVALYFAVANPNNDDADGQFWIYLVPDELNASSAESVSKSYFDTDPFTIDKPLFINATRHWNKDFDKRMLQGRRYRQHNQLLILSYEDYSKPLEEQEIHSHNLFKIVIPSAAKGRIRDELEREGYLDDLNNGYNEEITTLVSEMKTRYGI